MIQISLLFIYLHLSLEAAGAPEDLAQAAWFQFILYSISKSLQMYSKFLYVVFLSLSAYSCMHALVCYCKAKLGHLGSWWSRNTWVLEFTIFFHNK